MGWEQRGMNRYYYRKEWQDGRCVSIYIGAGESAQLTAAVEAARRRVAYVAREEVYQERCEREALRLAMKQPMAALQTLINAVLQANGYHQHKRQWRRLMHQGTCFDIIEAPRPATSNDIEAGLRALRDVLNLKAQGIGKKGAVTQVDQAQNEIARRAAVRQVLHDYPCIWSSVRKFLTNAKSELMKAAGCGPDTTSGLILERAMESMKNELGYIHAPLLEQLLIEQVVLTWFDLDIVQMKYARATSESHTLTLGAYWDRRVNSAQQRYLRAVETLARVRRIAQVTPLQVNIAGQQINVAGGQHTDR